MKQDANGRWVREEPEALGPNRAFGGYYRSADRQVRGKLLRGVPLQTTEDAVVAAVQMGYRVVDSQIDRGMRVARRLRSAAERQGSGDPGQMLDSAERLASKALLAGLQWLEDSAAEPGSPVKRLLSAEYRMVGSIFGLNKDDEKANDGERKRGKAGKDSPRPPKEDIQPPAAVPFAVSVLHASGSAKRAVTVCSLSLADGALAGEVELAFYHLKDASTKVLTGWISAVAADKLRLRIETDKEHPPGRWRAAVCRQPDDEQVGVIEIEL